MISYIQLVFNVISHLRCISFISFFTKHLHLQNKINFICHSSSKSSSPQLSSSGVHAMGTKLSLFSFISSIVVSRISTFSSQTATTDPLFINFLHFTAGTSFNSSWGLLSDVKSLPINICHNIEYIKLVICLTIT